jgi:hypothetical protein
MCAILQRVRRAGVTGVKLVVVTTGHHALLDKPVPGTGGLTTIAAHGHGAGHASATRYGILRAEKGGGVTGLDAVTVVESLGGSERPARSA